MKIVWVSGLILFSIQAKCMTPKDKLLTSIYSNNVRLVKTAIREGADVNEYYYRKNKVDRDTALMHCAFNPEINIEILEILIKTGPNIEAKGVANVTAIGYAVIKKNIKMIKFLVNYGANVNVVDDYGAHVIYWCVHKEVHDIEILKFLVEHGADVCFKNYGISILDHAKYNKCSDEIINFLEQAIIVVKKRSEESKKNIENYLLKDLAGIVLEYLGSDYVLENLQKDLVQEPEKVNSCCVIS